MSDRSIEKSCDQVLSIGERKLDRTIGRELGDDYVEDFLAIVSRYSDRAASDVAYFEREVISHGGDSLFSFPILIAAYNYW